MSRNWGRYCSVTLEGGAGMTIVSRGQRGLRISFHVFQSTIQSPNTAEIRLYNCTPQQVARFHNKEFTTITLDAGYDENHGVIYHGEIKESRYRHEDNVTDYIVIFCAMGDRAYNQSRISTTLAAGHTPMDRVNAALKTMAPFGASLGLVNVDLSQPRYPRGVPFVGMARDVLRLVSSTAGATWSIQNGNKVNIVDERKPIPGDPVITLNSKTGEVGYAEQTENGVVVRSFINPALDIHKKVKIDENSIQQADPDYQEVTSNVSQRNQNIKTTGKIAADGVYVIWLLERIGDMAPNGEWFDVSTVIATDESPNPTQAKTIPDYTQKPAA
jgi:hypothetical protein